MKITFITPPANMSGGIKVIAIYARLLAQKGHDVLVVSPAQRKVSFKQKVKSLITGRGWLREKSNDSFLSSVDINHRVLESYRPVCDSDLPDADIVIATWWETAEWVNNLLPSKGKKVYFIQGYEVFDYLPVDSCEATYKMPLRKIVIAQWLADVMEDLYGDNNVALVNNAVDHSQFYAPPRGKQALPTVGFLYHDTPLKGVDVTLKAIKKLHKLMPQLRVTSFGACDSATHSELLIGLPVEIQRLPPQDKIREIYAHCDVWVAASRSEGFNLPAMEAMACRTPIVSTRTGWPAEAIKNQFNGMLVDVDDVDAIVDAVKWVLTLPEDKWRDLSQNAFATVEDCSWDNSAKKFEQVLIEALGKP